MLKSRPIAKATTALRKSTRGFRPHNGPRPRITARVYSPYAARRQQHFIRSVTTVIALGSVAAAWQWTSRDLHAEEPQPEPELQFEKPRKKASSKEENRDIISSQHLQVRRSWENPGVYAWGSNSGKVAAPDCDDAFIKTPQRISFFDGKLLRDIKLDRKFGAAIDEKGDLVQWGTAFSKESTTPQVTLRRKDLVSLTLSRDRILCLSSDGTTYNIPVSAEEQKTGPKVSESSWIPFWTSTPTVSYRKLQPDNLAWGEKVSSIASGFDHTLLLTTKGRVFAAIPNPAIFPARGQLGIPGLTARTIQPIPTSTTTTHSSIDKPHELATLRGFEISRIAAGDFHSLVADTQGRVFSFGDNTYGQLGFDNGPETSFVDTPALLPLQRLYAGTSQVPRVTNIAAGGTNSYFTIDAERVASPVDDASSSPSNARLQLGRVSADTWACGQGIWGGLGNGRFTHVQTTPTKIPALSSLFEYDEAASRAIPIRLARLSVGTNHVAAVMDNVTQVHTSNASSPNETNWGADILFFGNNEFYQLGTGKRNNVASPVYIQPLDGAAEKKLRRGEEHRFQITPRKKVQVEGRWVELEQRVECGRSVTAVYSGV